MIVTLVIIMVLLAAILIHLKTVPPATTYHQAEHVAYELYKLYLGESWFLDARVSRTRLSEVVTVRVRSGHVAPNIPNIIKGVTIYVDYIDIPRA